MKTIALVLAFSMTAGCVLQPFHLVEADTVKLDAGLDAGFNADAENMADSSGDTGGADERDAGHADSATINGATDAGQDTTAPDADTADDAGNVADANATDANVTDDAGTDDAAPDAVPYVPTTSDKDAGLCCVYASVFGGTASSTCSGITSCGGIPDSGAFYACYETGCALGMTCIVGGQNGKIAACQ